MPVTEHLDQKVGMIIKVDGVFMLAEADRAYDKVDGQIHHMHFTRNTLMGAGDWIIRAGKVSLMGDNLFLPGDRKIVATTDDRLKMLTINSECVGHIITNWNMGLMTVEVRFDEDSHNRFLKG